MAERGYAAVARTKPQAKAKGKKIAKAKPGKDAKHG
jgi:hypothetical protein